MTMIYNTLPWKTSGGMRPRDRPGIHVEGVMIAPHIKDAVLTEIKISLEAIQKASVILLAVSNSIPGIYVVELAAAL